MKRIAIIPARSGSKGLKDKNIKLLNGKPLLYYTIKCALDSHCFDEVFVSTDSEEYAIIARDCGASVPFLRSAQFASDKSSSWDVVRETLEMYEKQGKAFNEFMLLQPTSPLRTSSHIIEAFDFFKNKKADCVVSVTPAEHSPVDCAMLNNDMNLKPFFKTKYFNMRRQDVPKYYRFNGAIYISSVKNFINNNFDIYQGDSFAYLMDKTSSVDIDDIIDFRLAEVILQNKQSE